LLRAEGPILKAANPEFHQEAFQCLIAFTAARNLY
jgi:hypothetical protein